MIKEQLDDKHRGYEDLLKQDKLPTDESNIHHAFNTKNQKR